jgi:PIN domain nuclease of toxin-antitoxin system
MRVLLDTNALLWALSGSPRIRPVEPLILSGDTEVFFSAASFWEIAIKTSIGKLAASVAEIRAAAISSGFLELHVHGQHAETLSNLPLHHRDPFDRMIVAQSITEPMRLLTGDRQLSAYSELVQVF